MIILIKIILIVALLYTFYQDVKERSVYWFLFPILALCMGCLYVSNTFFELFWRTTLVNLGIIILILLLLNAYAKFKLRTKLSAVFGSGDALFFICFCVAFPVASFIVLLVFSLLFSLILHSILNKKMKEPSVPLAGYMSMFLVVLYNLHWIGTISDLYSI